MSGQFLPLSMDNSMAIFLVGRAPSRPGDGLHEAGDAGHAAAHDLSAGAAVAGPGDQCLCITSAAPVSLDSAGWVLRQA